MTKLFGSITVFCGVNLVPYLMSFLMWLSEDGKIDYLIASILKSLFSIPTGLMGYAIQYDLGDWGWELLNMLGIIISIVIIKLFN